MNDVSVAVDDAFDNDNGDITNVVMNADDLRVSDNDYNDELSKAQQDDLTLKSCWEMAKVKKGNFIIDHGILYHLDQVESQKVCQLRVFCV